MKQGDTVQVKQWFHGVEHWIYATVIDPSTRQVQINHPANPDHGQIKFVAAEDLRFKADVQALAAAATEARMKTHYQNQVKQLS